MDRRDTIKSIIVGGIAGGTVLTACQPETEKPVENDTHVSAGTGDYGRTEEEKARDQRLLSEKFFSDHELATIAVLSDHILPATGDAGSATDAGVPDFIEFIVKDIPEHQRPMRGGLMWLDNHASKTFSKDFISCSAAEQKQILDQIAYPKDFKPEVSQGVAFFSLMRNLTMTGYYTSQVGVKDLGYQGNVANVWDGVPDEVLKKHGVEYEQEWLKKCIDQSTRDVAAKWDDAGNLLN